MVVTPTGNGARVLRAGGLGGAGGGVLVGAAAIMPLISKIATGAVLAKVVIR